MKLKSIPKMDDEMCRIYLIRLEMVMSMLLVLAILHLESFKQDAGLDTCDPVREVGPDPCAQPHLRWNSWNCSYGGIDRKRLSLDIQIVYLLSA